MTDQPKPDKKSKKGVNEAPVWRFILPLLVIFLAIGGPQYESRADDTGLYAEEIPEDAAFARVICFGTLDDDTLTMTLAGRKVEIAPNQASDFQVLEAGQYTLEIDGAITEFALEEGQRLTLAIRSDGSLIGQIATPQGKVAVGKTLLHLFNFHRSRAGLETVDGRARVIPPLEPHSHHFRAVNPVQVALAVAIDGNVKVPLAIRQLRAHTEYSIFVGDQRQMVFAADAFAR